MIALVVAAAAPSVMDRLSQIPDHFWLRLSLLVLAIIAVVLVWRKLAGANKVILAVIGGLALSLVGFNWIYERNEPSWASPTVSWLAGFLTSKGPANKARH
ncbi:MAG: hypothetical protein RIQ93_19 [Verrucomicrobiota bacterium]|jgi:hypothetical protein